VKGEGVQQFWGDPDYSNSYVKIKNNWKCASAPSYAITDRVGVT